MAAAAADASWMVAAGSVESRSKELIFCMISSMEGPAVVFMMISSPGGVQKPGTMCFSCNCVRSCVFSRTYWIPKPFCMWLSYHSHSS